MQQESDISKSKCPKWNAISNLFQLAARRADGITKIESLAFHDNALPSLVQFTH
jgi:hypothetical protein